ncbi:MAG TPA: primosomal protein N' [Thermoanaerobaculia bacterium]|nr:primosomal protein N' [Thermoanaerobaculia bacterium]
MASGLSAFVEVAIPLPVLGTFTYEVPDPLKDLVRLGSRVEVPWGPKRMTAYVVGFADETAIDRKRVKEVRAVLDLDEPALLPEIIELCRWAAEYYIAPLGEMLRVALPANLSAKGKRRVTRAEPAIDSAAAVAAGLLLEGDLALLESVGTRGIEYDRLLLSGKGAAGSLRRLRDAGVVTISDALQDAKGVRFDRFVLLDPRLIPEKLSYGQRLLIEKLEQRNGELPIRALDGLGLSSSSVNSLAKKGVVTIEKRARRHSMDGFFSELEEPPARELVLAPQQSEAIEAVRGVLGTFSPFLLEGVTGSGKTEVYIEIIREVVKRGGQAIVLVPEISLTPVVAARMKERFGDRIAILHSNLSASERHDQWSRARRGEVDVAVGPRSALFTPFPRLGILIVDEEGDGAYKQEESPRYNARDLAVVRARMQKIPVVLGSATPSLESRENAERGKYRLLRLTNRVESRGLPEAEVIDIRGERGEREDRGLIIFSRKLQEELTRTFAKGEQAVILMNRRGYAPFLLCRECEHDFRCKDCSVTLTVHRRAGQLVCHYCGFRRPIPLRCPACQGEILQPIGFGTEKVEERFRQHFPKVSVDVLDRDSTRRKGELVRILDRFQRGDSQALIGTQMISKGHHFPNVTTTAVINADSILGYPDFRSAEKTFYLLTQVAGRAGRGELAGHVYIQSAFPNHYAIQHALRHDYNAFFHAEIEFRKRFRYPPFSTMIALLFRGEDALKVEQASTSAGEELEREVAAIRDVRIQGPAPAPLARIKGVYRFQILVRSAQRQALRQAVEKVIRAFSFRGVEMVVDVDPINIL